MAPPYSSFPFPRAAQSVRATELFFYGHTPKPYIDPPNSALRCILSRT